MDAGPDRNRANTIRGIHLGTWSWLKGRAVLEDKTLGELLNTLIARYREEVESTGAGLGAQVRPGNTHGNVAVRGLDLGLLTWVRARARMNRTTPGDLVNEAIRLYRTSVERHGGFPGGPSFEASEVVTNTVKGVDRQLWGYLKGRAAVESMSMGEMVNELIARYKQEVDPD